MYLKTFWVTLVVEKEKEEKNKKRISLLERKKVNLLLKQVIYNIVEMFVLIAMYFELDWTKIKKKYCIFIFYLSRIRYRVGLIITVSRFSFGGPVAQADRRSCSAAGVPSSCLGLSLWISWSQGRFSRGFSRFPLPQISFHYFSTLISSISFHFIRLLDCASGVVVRHRY